MTDHSGRDHTIPKYDDPVWDTLEAQCELALNEVRDLYALDAVHSDSVVEQAVDRLFNETFGTADSPGIKQRMYDAWCTRGRVHDVIDLLTQLAEVTAKTIKTIKAMDPPPPMGTLGAPRLPEPTNNACPDGGTCWHRCPVDDDSFGVYHVEKPKGLPCWRVNNAGPLSGTRDDDTWDEDERRRHGDAH